MRISKENWRTPNHLPYEFTDLGLEDLKRELKVSPLATTPQYNSVCGGSQKRIEGILCQSLWSSTAKRGSQKRIEGWSATGGFSYAAQRQGRISKENWSLCFSPSIHSRTHERISKENWSYIQAIQNTHRLLNNSEDLKGELKQRWLTPLPSLASGLSWGSQRRIEGRLHRMVVVHFSIFW